MTGYLGSLNERQQVALNQFRNAVSDVKRPSDTDASLLRWLRARDFDVGRADSMYRHDIEWRKQNGVDDMLKNYKTPQIVKENFPGAILHPCKDGCPMWIVPAGINAGQELETQYLVIDFDNFSIRNVYSWQVVKAITDVLQMMEDHFPECLEKCIAINAPSFFPILWRLIRPFLTQRTADKVEVFVDGWKELLLSIIDAASLPAHWGGDMVGPGNDPRCRHKVNYGGRFEEGVERGESLFGEAGVEQRTVSRRDRWELQVGVTKPGSRISWRFQVAAGDLAFGLRLLAGEPLLPLRRVETCSHAPQEGSWLCDSPGTYVLEFDNTHSWFTSKTLAYEVNVHSPEDAH
ncbi:SEC14-like protein 2 [Dermacentor albipictus]|uniref:SEC14-like protein 2 n=1 Tax=Dermacentor albipictus TaxID=60249 RepID=UPI0038FC0A70